MDKIERDIKVSVVIAVYNSEKYLRSTLDSVCAQSLKEIEIICVDDGSADNSLSILQEYAKHDERIIVLQQMEQTDGAAAARNLGMENAHGQYLSVLDSDDFFESNMLEKVYKRAVDTDADIVIYDGYVFDEYNNADKEVGYILHPEYLPVGKDVFMPRENAELLFQMTIGAAWNCMVRRSLVENNQIRFQSFHHADDLGFVYVAFACASRIAVLNDRFVHYRLNNAESQAANIGKWPQTSYLALMQLKKELMLRGIYEDFKVTFAQQVMIYVIFYLDGMRDYSAFSKLYKELQDKYLNELGVFEIPDYKYSNRYWLEIRDFINGKTAAEYLFRKMYKLPPFAKDAAWREKMPEKSSVVIYGAGNEGTNLFSELQVEKKYCIKAWVDRQYENIGYPVVSPEIIKTLDFDYVLVAVAAEGLYRAISTYLLECGVKTGQICWIGDIGNGPTRK